MAHRPRAAHRFVHRPRRHESSPQRAWRAWLADMDLPDILALSTFRPSLVFLWSFVLPLLLDPKAGHNRQLRNFHATFLDPASRRYPAVCCHRFDTPLRDGKIGNGCTRTRNWQWQAARSPKIRILPFPRACAAWRAGPPTCSERSKGQGPFSNVAPERWLRMPAAPVRHATNAPLQRTISRCQISRTQRDLGLLAAAALFAALRRPTSVDVPLRLACAVPPSTMPRTWNVTWLLAATPSRSPLSSCMLAPAAACNTVFRDVDAGRSAAVREACFRQLFPCVLQGTRPPCSPRSRRRDAESSQLRRAARTSEHS